MDNQEKGYICFKKCMNQKVISENWVCLQARSEAVQSTPGKQENLQPKKLQLKPEKLQPRMQPQNPILKGGN